VAQGPSPRPFRARSPARAALRDAGGELHAEANLHPAAVCLDGAAGTRRRRLRHRRRDSPGLAAHRACLSRARTGSTRSIADFSRPIDDWKAIVSEIAGNAEPGDVVIAVPAEGSIAVGYYARRHANFPPVVCVPGCYPQRNLPRTYMSNFGAPKLIEEDGAIVEEALKNHRRVWLVQVSVALYDPKGIVRKRIESARSFVRYYGNSLAKVELFE
jgi:hypothetical protein